MLLALATALLSFTSEAGEAATLADEPALPRDQVARKLEFATVPAPARLSRSTAGACVDMSPACPGWAQRDLCEQSPSYYHDIYRKSCGQCAPRNVGPAPGRVR